MLYPRSFLEQRIKEEKLRTGRTSSQFSVVWFNPFKLFSDDHTNTKTALNSIIKFLDQETRETDIKGWWDRSFFAVLLPDTTPENALLFIDKLVSRIQKNPYGGAELIRKASFEIFTFPNTQRFNNDGKENKKEEHSKTPRGDSNQNFHKFRHIINSPEWDFSNMKVIKKYHALIKRSLDILLSIPILIILSPLFLLCAILIKINSPGSVFYKQTRVGINGKSFTFLKFRSMYHNSDETVHKEHIKNLMNGSVGLKSIRNTTEKSYKLIEDERVTRFGRFLRKTSIDELPQFINVLKGDMTLVGPRPHPVYEVDHYNLWHSYRLHLKPGVTSLALVYGRSDINYEDTYRLDLQYVKKTSLILDIKILLRTIPVVLSRRGAC